MNFLVHAHSGLRWIALILLVAAIINAGLKLKSGGYLKKDKMLNLFAMVVLHVQFLIGLALYFMSGRVNMGEGWMKNPMFRFFGMEHFIGMLLAIVLITIGRRKAENATNDSKKHRTVLVWYLIGFILILAFIPWPFRQNLGIESWF